MSKQFKPGVVTGDDVQAMFQLAKKKKFALPAANVISSSTINAVLEASKELNAPAIIQFSNGGAIFNAGKGLSNENQAAAIAGGIAGARHVHILSEAYGVPVILHTDHCAKKLLPWLDGLIAAGEEFYKQTGKPLFSSHMIDLSEEPLKENIEICKTYLQRMSKIGMTLEIELGITGGEEDGVDNTDADASKLYTQPEEVAYAYEELKKVSDRFTIAASFGNVHGVYKPGNVKLTPKILDNSQKFIEKKHHTEKNPVDFVFHGGSGSSEGCCIRVVSPVRRRHGERIGRRSRCRSSAGSAIDVTTAAGGWRHAHDAPGRSPPANRPGARSAPWARCGHRRR